MSNEFVMVPRELLERALHHGLTGFLSVAEVDGLRAALGAHHQGEPVELPKRKVHHLDPSFLPDGDKGWNACLDEIAKLGPLFTHADPGEVERLQLEIEKLRLRLTLNDDALIQDGFVRIENRALRSRIDEQNELLREIKNARDWNGSYRALEKRIDAALSASAEPSAPKCRKCGDPCTHDDDGHDECRFCTAGVPSNPNDASAPVERDERAEFEEFCEEVLGLKTDRLITGGYQSFGADNGWRSWQARAALERKP